MSTRGSIGALTSATVLLRARASQTCGAYAGSMMPELELTRTPGDRRLYALDGVGTLRLEGLVSRAAAAEAGGARWRFARRVWSRRAEATDSLGSVVGEFKPGTFRRGGTVRWGDRELSLRPASAWRERYALVEGDRELALLDAKGRGRRPVKVTVADAGAVEPGLLLFATFVARGLSEDSGAVAATTSSSAGG